MAKLDQKGFTLLEVLAVIAIIAIIGLVSISGVLNTISSGKESTDRITVDNIKTASIEMYEEIEFVGTILYDYTFHGKTSTEIKIGTDKKITFHLQALVSNGFLKGSVNEDARDEAGNLIAGVPANILKNTKDNQYIGDCQITVAKTVDSGTGKTVYGIESNSLDVSYCPKTVDYK